MQKFNLSQFEQGTQYLLFLKEYRCDDVPPRIIRVADYQIVIGQKLAVRCPELFPDTVLTDDSGEIRDRHGNRLADLYMTDKVEVCTAIELSWNEVDDMPDEATDALLFDGYGLATQIDKQGTLRYIKLTYPLLAELNADPEKREQINEYRFGNRLMRDFTIQLSDAAVCFGEIKFINQQRYEQLCRQGFEDMMPEPDPSLVMTTLQELAEAAFALAPGDGIDFRCDEDGEGWNISKINIQDTDLIVMGIYGGGHTYIHDLVDNDDSDLLEDFIGEKLAHYTPSHVVFMKREKPSRLYTPGELYCQIEAALGAKYLLIYRNKKEMTDALDGKIYAISDTDGTYLCDILEEDYIRLTDDLTILDTASANTGVKHCSDWVVACPEYRSKVQACRVAILFIEK